MFAQLLTSVLSTKGQETVSVSATMASSGQFQKISSFLQYYAPERFDWEFPEAIGSKFIWARQLRLKPRKSAYYSRERTSTTSSDSSTFSDMSISLGDSIYHSCEASESSLSDMLISLSSAREPSNTSTSSAHISSSLSDMLISLDTDDFSDVSPDFDDFAANIPAQMHTIQERMTGTYSFDMSFSQMKSCISFSDVPLSHSDLMDQEDESACYEIYIWLESLFVDVAQCFMDCEGYSSYFPMSWSQTRPDKLADGLQVTSKEVIGFDVDEDIVPIVKLPPAEKHRHYIPLRCIRLSTKIDHEANNTEQVSTISSFLISSHNLTNSSLSTYLPRMLVCGVAE